jgi:hypothetical protein
MGLQCVLFTLWLKLVVSGGASANESRISQQGDQACSHERHAGGFGYGGEIHIRKSAADGARIAVSHRGEVGRKAGNGINGGVPWIVEKTHLKDREAGCERVVTAPIKTDVEPRVRASLEAGSLGTGVRTGHERFVEFGRGKREGGIGDCRVARLREHEEHRSRGAAREGPFNLRRIKPKFEVSVGFVGALPIQDKVSRLPGHVESGDRGEARVGGRSGRCERENRSDQENSRSSCRGHVAFALFL